MQVRSEIVDLSFYILPFGTPKTLGDDPQATDYPGTTTPLQVLEKRGDPAPGCLLIPGVQFVRDGPQMLLGMEEV